MTQPLSIAVVGHTNVGKTSLMRTLTRDASFGDVAASPGTTRGVERARLAVGDSALLFYDTPGLEDSAGLLAYLKARVEDGSTDWVESIASISAGSAAKRFDQEGKALRQVIDSDLLFYVIDVRDKVRAKHRCELEILMRCARPMVAVLNFVAQSRDGEESWRETLARTNIHAVAPFDTFAYDEEGERALYEKARTLLDERSALFEQRLADIAEARRALVQAGAGAIAEMVEDIGALRRVFPADDPRRREQESDALEAEVIKREAACSKALLRAFKFKTGDYLPEDLSIEDGVWSDNPFDPDVLSRFGLNLGKAAATGAAFGLGVDILFGGMTLGGAAATGALAGAGLDALRRHGSSLKERLSGQTALQIEPESFALITARQIGLLKALYTRGHGAQGGIVADDAQAMLKPLLPHMKASLSQRLGADGKAELVDLIAKASG